MRAWRAGKCAGIVVDLSRRLRDKPRDGLRVFAILEDVGRDSRGSRNWQSAQFYPFAWLQFSDVQPHIRPAGLASLLEGEVMLISGAIGDPVDGGCRSVRNASISGC